MTDLPLPVEFFATVTTAREAGRLRCQCTPVIAPMELRAELGVLMRRPSPGPNLRAWLRERILSYRPNCASRSEPV